MSTLSPVNAPLSVSDRGEFIFPSGNATHQDARKNDTVYLLQAIRQLSTVLDQTNRIVLTTIHRQRMVESQKQIASRRLNEFRSLATGWNDGSGEPVSDIMIDRADAIVGQWIESGILRPRLYPTPNGGILAEWRIDSWMISAEFFADSNVLEIVGVNVLTRERQDLDVDCSGADIGSRRVVDYFNTLRR